MQKPQEMQHENKNSLFDLAKELALLVDEIDQHKLAKKTYSKKTKKK